MGFLTQTELNALGFRSVGRRVLISNKCSIYGANNISIGDNVRVDDFSILSSGNGGFIELHSHIHIAAYVSLFGAGGITIEDFCGVSSYTTIYSANDDYGGDYLMGPEIDEDCLSVVKAPVRMCKYTTIGSHSVILPGVVMNEGSILGACSLTSKSLEPWKIYGGVPAKILKSRKNGLLDKAHQMEERWRIKK